MKAFVNCPNCATAGWAPVKYDDVEQVAECTICHEQYPLNHKAVEGLTNG